MQDVTKIDRSLPGQGRKGEIRLTCPQVQLQKSPCNEKNASDAQNPSANTTKA